MYIHPKENRHGIVAVKVALLLVPMMGILALGIDYGYLLKVRTDLQRSADASALAAVRDLLPASDGSQDFSAVRSTAGHYADSNIVDVTNFQVLDGDIQTGRYDPSTVYSDLELLDSGIHDTVRVTLRRDTQANSQVALFFANVLGIGQSNVTATATAVMRKGRTLRPGNSILPFAVPESVWLAHDRGESFDVYRDGGIRNQQGVSVPGNWGTVDIGDQSNSTSDIEDQILTGLRQSDLDALNSDGRIPYTTHIASDQHFYAQGETGMSIGIRDSVQAIHNTVKYIPIFDTLTQNGNNAEYHIIGWGAVRVVGSHWAGNTDTFVRFEKTYTYDRDLVPIDNLSNTSGTIDGAFTTAVLIE